MPVVAEWDGAAAALDRDNDEREGSRRYARSFRERNASAVCVVAAASLAVGLACSGSTSQAESPMASLHMEHIGTFGSPSDPASPDPLIVAVSHDKHRRQVFITAGPPGTEVLIYEEDGEYTRSIGRSGAGPGELVGIRYLAVVEDTLHVFSNGPRHTRFGMDGEVLRVDRMAVSPRRVFFSRDGSLLVHGTLNTPTGFAFPVHLIAPSGEVQSFGRSDMKEYTGEPEPMVVAVQSRDSVWIASPLEYQIELWTPDNRVARRIQRQAAWFAWPQKKNESFLSDLWIDTTRLELWVAGGHLRNSTPARPVFTSVIEVVDLRSGSVIAQDSMTGPAFRFTSDGDLFRIEEGELGHTRVALWRARVSGDSIDRRRR
jgi:hypothetical protein